MTLAEIVKILFSVLKSEFLQKIYRYLFEKGPINLTDLKSCGIFKW